MTESVTFWVDGEPAPQGSKRHVGGGRMIEAAKGHAAWRKAVHDAAKQQAQLIGKFPDGPLHLTITFYLPHGKQKEITPWKRLDLDKLTRSIGDSLKTGGLIVDDSRFTTLTVEKVWEVSDAPGALITVRRKL